MHILIIHQAFAALEEPGGTRHHELARYLTAHGHKVTVIASSVSYITGAPLAAANAGLGTDGITILRASASAAHHRSFWHRLLSFLGFMFSAFFLGLRVRDVDIVWGTSPPIFQAFTAWILARWKGARFLFEVRDLWPTFAIAIGVLKNPLLIALSERLERFLYRRADMLIVNSPGFVAHVEAAAGKSVKLVPNGSDPAMFDPADRGAAFRRAHGLQDKFVVTYAGAHGISNDLDTVLVAAQLLLAEDSIRIVLVGDGKEKQALQERAATLRLKNVLFLPAVPKSGMPGVLAGSDACLAILQPLEEYKTTYPNKVFDYMAAGRPVILAVDGVIRRVVEAAECGVFVPPGRADEIAAAVRTLAGDRQRAREMGLKGRAYLVDHFSRERMGEELLELLVQLRGGA